MIYLFPLMFIVFGYRFPAGLSLYWAASTVTSLIQQYRFHGLGGLEGWIPGKKVELEVVDVVEGGDEGLKEFSKALVVKKRKKKKKKKRS